MNDEEVGLSAEVRLVGPVMMRRPSNAQFRKMMRDKTLPRRKRMRAYSVLQYRKKHTHGR